MCVSLLSLGLCCCIRLKLTPSYIRLPPLNLSPFSVCGVAAKTNRWDCSGVRRRAKIKKRACLPDWYEYAKPTAGW